MGDEIFSALGFSLASTVVLELLPCVLMGYRSRWTILMVVLANILTNPPVVLCFNILSAVRGFPEVPVIAVLELMAVLAEWLCYKYRAGEIKRPFLFSLGLNCFSYFTGLLIQFVVQ